MTPRPRTMRLLAIVLVLVAGLVLCAGAPAHARGGAYRSTKHGDPGTGVLRLLDEPRGECSHCHFQHASDAGIPTGGPFEYLLFAPDDNALCATCHAAPGAWSVYPGEVAYEQSLHATSPRAVWPGPTPPARESAGLCLGCHDPHGVRDATGVLPALTFAREEKGCLPCHDGTVALRDVSTDFLEPFRHPLERSGVHDASEGGSPARFAASPIDNRHAECVDCHNPHGVQSDLSPPLAPEASNRLRGVSRVRVTNGVAGTAPLYTYAGPGETAFALEHEVCFKCHSSWTVLPAGQPDLALLLNPNNPSFHPVEARGRNAGIAAGAFVTGWSWESLVFCSDCHGGEGEARGPHGSPNPHLLRRPYDASPLASAAAPGDLCFACHGWATYADPAATPAVRSYSRFGGGAGHVRHVASGSVPCFACHESHGSATLAALVATGRSPGITSYTQTSNGGTCFATCHGRRSYVVSYPR